MATRNRKPGFGRRFHGQLEWVRELYFGGIFSQLTPIASSGLDLEIDVIDERGTRVWGMQSGAYRNPQVSPALS